MKPLAEYIGGSLINEDTFKAFRRIDYSSGSNPPEQLDDYYGDLDRIDIPVDEFLSSKIAATDLDPKKIQRYQNWLAKNEEKLRILTVYYRYRPTEAYALLINKQSKEEDITYYVMEEIASSDCLIELLDWLKANLSKCITFAKKWTY